MDINLNISKLDLSNKGLETFPQEILELRNLKKLNLSNNKIKQLPKSIDKLKRLENLDLSNNQLTSIYSNLCKLNKLRVLNLSNNNIKQLPNQIGYLTNLRKLILSRNKLKSIPSELGNLKYIESLSISTNDFEQFPKVLFKLKRLKQLWLNNNKFQDFPLNEFSMKLPLLKSFYCFGQSSSLRDNINENFRELSSIKGNSINELKKLETKLSKATSLNNYSNNIILKNKVNKNKIFISYSHKDAEWRERIEESLKTMEFEGIKIEVWSDKKIKAGQEWKKEIEKALDESYIAILIVSPAFLASEFIQNNELPQILENANIKGTKVISLIARPCRYVNNKTL